MNTPEQDLVDLNIKIGEAEAQRDAGFLGSILADGLKFRRANGTIVDKLTYLADLQDRKNTFEYLHSEEVQSTVYENTAIVALLVRAKGTKGGTPFEGTFRNIRLFLNEPDKQPVWQCYMWFNARIQDT
jgi:hypothetical protein